VNNRRFDRGSAAGRTDRELRLLSRGLIFGVILSGVFFAALDLDLLAYPGFGIPCLFHAITGIECPGCGMTRALVLIGQLQWETALHMNPLVFPLLGAAAFQSVTSSRETAAIYDPRSHDPPTPID
jgi:hypothetical protein